MKLINICRIYVYNNSKINKQNSEYFLTIYKGITFFLLNLSL